jgi:hypothetical protein
MSEDNVSTAAVGDDRIINTDRDSNMDRSRPSQPVVDVERGTTTIHGTAATITIELNPDAKLVGSKPLTILDEDKANRLALREAIAISTDQSNFEDITG